MTAWTIFVRVLAAVAMVAYPVVVWLGMSSGSPRQIAIILLAVMTPAVLMKSRRAGASRQVRGLAAVPATILAATSTARMVAGTAASPRTCLEAPARRDFIRTAGVITASRMMAIWRGEPEDIPSQTTTG